jgi:hypothetical protein
MMVTSPIMAAATIIILGRTRLTAPWTMAPGDHSSAAKGNW